MNEIRKITFQTNNRFLFHMFWIFQIVCILELNRHQISVNLSFLFSSFMFFSPVNITKFISFHWIFNVFVQFILFYYFWFFKFCFRLHLELLVLWTARCYVAITIYEKPYLYHRQTCTVVAAAAALIHQRHQVIAMNSVIR